MQAFVICGNLFDLPTLTGPLKSAGFEVKTAPTAKSAEEKLAAALATGTPPQLVLIDLETPNINVAAIASLLSLPADAENSESTQPAVQLVAYGPHVHRETLETAASLGCRVMTRGQLFRDVAGNAALWAAS